MKNCWGLKEAKEITSRMVGKKVLIYFDPDVDGLFGGLMCYRFLKGIGCEDMIYYINNNREHGFKVPIDVVKEHWQVDSILAVDFSMSRAEIEEVVDTGIEILLLDHHLTGESQVLVEKNGKVGLCINNQDPIVEDEWRFLSGCGVAYEVLSQIYSGLKSEENAALVGITLLSDIRDIENDHARDYLEVLYNHKYNGYIRYLIDCCGGTGRKFDFGTPRLDREFVDFQLSPKINSSLRFGKQNDMVRWVLGDESAMNANLQSEQRELVEQLMDDIKITELPNIRVITLTKRGDSGVSNFVGLIANRMINHEGKKKSVFCFMADEHGFRRGSFRGRNGEAHYLSQVQEFLDAEGHGAAFGIKGLKGRIDWKALDMACLKAEDGLVSNQNIIKVGSLLEVGRRRLENIARENQFRLSQNVMKIEITGNNYEVAFKNNKVIKYNVNGFEVVGFGDVLMATGYIFPTMKNGYIKLYLVKR